MEDFCTVTCPHCFQKIQIAIPDPFSRSGEFDYDCEVCCRAILVKWQRDSGGELFADAEAAEA
ncbi:MAG: CPXCG motif-containing cysteine-rich protein [Opitutales bacterium]|nr:CPXCG motif-containing cysteine-rich protein [Opitutales bacterium]MCH8540347.1 CPXCG motif-containing cysteine-rich protein [Opitutales bacterium]